MLRILEDFSAVLRSGDTEAFRRMALLSTLGLGIPAAAIALNNARNFPAATGFDIFIMAAMLLGLVGTAALALLRRDLTGFCSRLLIVIFGGGFAIRIAATFLGPYSFLPLTELKPPYTAWLPIFFVLSFVLLEARAAFRASILFYAFTALVVVAYAVPLASQSGGLDSGVVGLLQQFLFGHLLYIVLLASIPFFQAGKERTEAENDVLRALRLSEDRFRDAFEYASIGMALVSLEGRFTEVNDALCELFEYSREELLRKDFQTITHPDDLEKDLRQLDDLVAGHTDFYQLEKRYFTGQGRCITTILSVSAVRREDGSPDYFVSQIEDVTAEREYRAELQAANRVLADQARALEDANEELTAFAHVVSHDLREPLRGVKSFADLLATRKKDLLDDEGKRFLSFIAMGAERGQEMINALLAYSKAGRNVIDEAVDSADCVAIALENLRGAIDSRAATVEIADSLPQVMSSPVGLQAVFQNLIGNALKFGREGESTRVRITVKTDGEFAEFAVSDNGCGFDARHADRIFDVFNRLHGREVEGTGIGLAICRKTIEKHGGRIWVESTPGQGSTFRFTQRLV